MLRYSCFQKKKKNTGKWGVSGLSHCRCWKKSKNFGQIWTKNNPEKKTHWADDILLRSQCLKEKKQAFCVSWILGSLMVKGVRVLLLGMHIPICCTLFCGEATNVLTESGVNLVKKKTFQAPSPMVMLPTKNSSCKTLCTIFLGNCGWF